MGHPNSHICTLYPSMIYSMLLMYSETHMCSCQCKIRQKFHTLQQVSFCIVVSKCILLLNMSKIETIAWDIENSMFIVIAAWCCGEGIHFPFRQRTLRGQMNEKRSWINYILDFLNKGLLKASRPPKPTDYFKTLRQMTNVSVKTNSYCLTSTPAMTWVTFLWICGQNYICSTALGNV